MNIMQAIENVIKATSPASPQLPPNRRQRRAYDARLTSSPDSQRWSRKERNLKRKQARPTAGTLVKKYK